MHDVSCVISVDAFDTGITGQLALLTACMFYMITEEIRHQLLSDSLAFMDCGNTSQNLQNKNTMEWLPFPFSEECCPSENLDWVLTSFQAEFLGS